MIVRFSLFALILTGTKLLYAQSCNVSNIRLDQKGGALSKLQVQDQDGLGTCYANTASLLLQAADPKHRRFSYLSMAMTYAQNTMTNEYGLGKWDPKNKEYDFFFEGGFTCKVIDVVQKKKFACSQESMRYEDLSTKNLMDSDKAQRDVFTKVKELNYRYWHSPREKNGEQGPRQIINLYDQFIAEKKAESELYCSQNSFNQAENVFLDLAVDLKDKIENAQIELSQAQKISDLAQANIKLQEDKNLSLSKNIQDFEKALLAENPKFDTISELRESNQNKLNRKFNLNQKKVIDIKNKIQKLDQLQAELKVEENNLLLKREEENNATTELNSKKTLLDNLKNTQNKIGSVELSPSNEASFQDQFKFDPNLTTKNLFNEKYKDFLKNNKNSKSDDLNFKEFFHQFFTGLEVNDENLDYERYDFSTDKDEFDFKSNTVACVEETTKKVFNTDKLNFKNNLIEYGACHQVDLGPHDKLLDNLSDVLYILSSTHDVNELGNVVKLMPGNVDLARAMLGPTCYQGGTLEVPQNTKCITETTSEYLKDALNDKNKAYQNMNSMLNNKLLANKPVAVTFCTEFMNKSFDSKQCTKRDEKDGVPSHGYHSVTIIGQECKNGRLRYLIQNSWGEDSCPKSSELECLKGRGAFWVESNNLLNNTIRFESMN